MEAVVSVLVALVVMVLLLAVVLAVVVWVGGLLIDYRRAQHHQKLEHVERVRQQQLHRVRVIGRRYRRQLDEL